MKTGNYRVGRTNSPNVRKDRNTAAVFEPPASGSKQIIATRQAAKNGDNPATPDGRTNALSANPVLASSVVHLLGKQNFRQFKDLR